MVFFSSSKTNQPESEPKLSEPNGYENLSNGEIKYFG
jgi:hypothetical protein